MCGRERVRGREGGRGTHTHTHTHTHTVTHTHTRTHARTHTHTQSHSHMRTHTYTHTHTHKVVLSSKLTIAVMLLLLNLERLFLTSLSGLLSKNWGGKKREKTHLHGPLVYTPGALVWNAAILMKEGKVGAILTPHFPQLTLLFLLC